MKPFVYEFQPEQQKKIIDVLQTIDKQASEVKAIQGEQDETVKALTALSVITSLVGLALMAKGK